MPSKAITSLAILSALLATAASALPTSRSSPQISQHASASDKLAYLVSNVCVPVIGRELSEAEAIKEARLIEVHMPYWPETKPRGLRQYHWPFDGTAAVSINAVQNICDLHVRGSDFATFEASLFSVLTGSDADWKPVPIDKVMGFTRRSYCRERKAISVETFEGNSSLPNATRIMKRNGSSFDVSVTGRPCPVAHESPVTPQ